MWFYVNNRCKVYWVAQIGFFATSSCQFATHKQAFTSHVIGFPLPLDTRSPPGPSSETGEGLVVLECTDTVHWIQGLISKRSSDTWSADPPQRILPVEIRRLRSGPGECKLSGVLKGSALQFSSKFGMSELMKHFFDHLLRVKYLTSSTIIAGVLQPLYYLLFRKSISYQCLLNSSVDHLVSLT